MPTKSRDKTDNGTLIRGADGALYFVPDGEEWAFRLPNEKTTEAQTLLDQHNFVASQDQIPAFHGSGLVHRIGNPHEIEIVLKKLESLILISRKLHAR
jgi:hypothetical protein